MKQTMEKQQTWPKRHQLFTFIAAVYCITSYMTVNVAANSGDAKESTSKVVVQGEVYCEGLSQHHELLKDAEVQVTCTNPGAKAKEVGRTNARGTFTITLQDYDYEAWGSNGCKAKLLSSLHATCTTPTNMGGGLTGTNLILKDKSNKTVLLTAGPFAFKQSEVSTTSEKNLQKTVDSSTSGLWYSPPNSYHSTSPPPPHYESPPYRHKSREHEGHREHHDHKSRDKDCSPKRESHHHRSPVYHSPPYYYKSPPYHNEHNDVPRHESSPYNKPPPYSNPAYPPPYHYTPSGHNHKSPPYVQHTPFPLHHHDTYEALPKHFYPPDFQGSNDVKAAPAQAKESSP